MPTQPVSLIKGDKVSSADYRDALPVNMIAVSRPIKDSPGYLITHPGLVRFGTGAGRDRGGVWNERFLEHYRVSGGSFQRVSPNGAVIPVGSISGNDQCEFAQSFETQAIVADGKYYLYDQGGGLRQVTGPNVGNPIDVTWIDGYYFFTDGENLYHTELTDEEAIDPLDFATSQFSPDPTLGVEVTQDNQVAVFNRYTTEWFLNRATDNFAFQRVPGKAVRAGIVGTHAKAPLEGDFIALGGRKEESPTVHILTPGKATNVATREIERLIAQYSESDLAKVVMEARTEKKDSLIYIHLPNETLIYNHSISKQFGVNQAWSIVKTGVNDAPWTAINGIFDPRIGGNGAWIYGDKSSSRIGSLTDDVSTTYDEKNEFILYSPFMFIDSASVDQLEIQTVPGFTDEKATVAVSITQDGLTYGLEYWNLYSDSKQYGQRFILRRMGYVRDYVGFKFRAVTDARMAFTSLEVAYG